MHERLNQLISALQNMIPGLALTVLSTLVCLVLLEFVLRAEIDHLPIIWANQVGDGYVIFGNGIYRFDTELNMKRMRPHYVREMFFNGYHWTHRGDWMGFRNPVDRAAVDVALIGDSMIYGHGLEENQTVSSHLERLIGRPVANLGEQGAAMDYEYQILRHDAVRLHPRYVFIFFLNNDITDVMQRVKDADNRRFLALPLSDHTTPWFSPSHPYPNHPLNDLYVVRSSKLLETLVNMWMAALRARWHSNPARGAASVGAVKPVTAAIAPSDARDDALLPLDPAWISVPPFAGDPKMQLALRFHLRAISKANDFAKRNGMRMSFIFISTPRVDYNTLYEEINAEYCREHGIDFFSLRPALESARRAGKEINLPHDGHLTDAGAAVTAKALVDHFHLSDTNTWH
jgi:hypothetical protein